MKKTESEIVMIETQRLQHHPDNPRKDLGDVTELADSIKKNGIMQNLTVIPIECTEYDPEKQLRANKISPSSNFYVLIGNRRLEACLQAGLEEVPCRIVSNISKKEQVGIMLEENMQRSDLTIIEQAEGFQMMLDLGETVDSISEKTGFSKASDLANLYAGKGLWEIEKSEDYEKYIKWRDSLTALDRAIISLKNVKNNDLYTWDGKYREEYAERAIAVVDFFRKYGFSITDEMQQLLDGTSELYVKDEEKGEGA